MHSKLVVAIVGLVATLGMKHCRADDPPIEGAPLMTGTNSPRYHAITNRPNRVMPVKRPLPAAEATNAQPQTLQSVESAKAAPAPMAPPKGPGMVIYGAYGFKVGNEAFWVIPEKYLSDLTNHYQFQYAHKIVLPEP